MPIQTKTKTNEGFSRRMARLHRNAPTDRPLPRNDRYPT
jgi:hypothetical protein